ncbi:dihydroxy-acid dehydratase [Candidatus Woesearchaeota archaeon]|nr:dihydroxy-acid dehydratase [Candidatus Woesearchaeota archaeon]
MHKNADIVKGKPAARSCLYGTRRDRHQIDKPAVAIVYSHNEVCPGHLLLDELARYVQIGVAEAGGHAYRINAGVGVCDGIAMGHDGMKYSLPSRELNRDCVVDMVLAHDIFDGVVYMGACDKNLPGYLMAAASLKHLPGMFVTPGPMLPGCVDGKGADVVTSFTADAQYSLGEMDQAQYDDIMEESCPGPGSCAGLFTANSMACVTEALGLTLPGMATAHAVDNRKYRLATKTGRHIMIMIEEGVTIGDILTEEAFYNALTVDMAIGASTNTVLHVPAIAAEAGYEFDLDAINEISAKTPNLLRLSPASEHRMIDFDRQGGIPVVMSRLRELLDTKVKTVTGSLEDRLNAVRDSGSTEVIKSVKDSYSSTGGIAVYRGNLAPEGSVIKESGVDPSVPKLFEGTARIFDCEEDCTAYIKAKKVKPGDVLIIRNEGPAGGPGMREMLYPTSAIKGLEMDKEVALLTDGRFSGGTAGICIGHIEPEAYNGGPLAFVEEGDKIEIDMGKREINVMDQKQMLTRGFKRVEKPVNTEILRSFRRKFARRV